jgi:hypothetical protein
MYSTNRRLERELLDLARSKGYDGSPFLRERPAVGSLDQELAAIDLSLSVSPRPQTPQQRQLAREWARNIVFSSEASPQAKSAPLSPTVATKIERERRRVTS